MLGVFNSLGPSKDLMHKINSTKLIKNKGKSKLFNKVIYKKDARISGLKSGHFCIS